MADKTETGRLTEDMDGWLSRREGELLYELARACRGRGAIVEIGSWKGKSTTWLGRGARQGGHGAVYAVDPHTGSSEHHQRLGAVWTFDVFQANVRKAGLDDVVIPVVRTSAEAARSFTAPVELLFIDGAHEYDAVRLDFDCWFPKLITGGIIAFHDATTARGVRRAVATCVCTATTFRDVALVDSILFARKVEHTSLADRIRNRRTLARLRFRAWRRHPLAPVKRLPWPRPFRVAIRWVRSRR